MSVLPTWGCGAAVVGSAASGNARQVVRDLGSVAEEPGFLSRWGGAVRGFSR